MDRKKYYVSVQSRTIMENQGDAAYELEIIATPEDVEKLVKLFEALEDTDESSYFKGYILQYHHDEFNDDYDSYLNQIYQTLYNVGTEETKAHISSMGIIN
ncbi:MAG: hypothetical protein JWM44_1947 [Bacilli bacterium]|nr:hypothetical protein [Bacilli bacterium]